MDRIEYNTMRDSSTIYNGKEYHRVKGPWALYANSDILFYVLAIADTPYRMRIAMGIESLSGLTLGSSVNGRVRREYKESAIVFLRKLESMGVKCTEVQGCRRARVLLLG